MCLYIKKAKHEGNRRNDEEEEKVCVCVCVCINTLESVCLSSRRLTVGKHGRVNPLKGGMDEVLCVCVCVWVCVSVCE
jgi:hypothetical protein